MSAKKHTGIALLSSLVIGLSINAFRTFAEKTTEHEKYELPKPDVIDTSSSYFKRWSDSLLKSMEETHGVIETPYDD